MGKKASNTVEMDVSGRLCFALFFSQPGEKRGSLPSAVWEVFFFFSFSLSPLPSTSREFPSVKCGKQRQGCQSPRQQKKSAFSLPNLCVCLKKTQKKNRKKAHFLCEGLSFPFRGAELRRLTVSNRFYHVWMETGPDRDEDEDEDEET